MNIEVIDHSELKQMAKNVKAVMRTKILQPMGM
jgi:D-ribose pyranose/furanose isomerase RbsD